MTGDAQTRPNPFYFSLGPTAAGRTAQTKPYLHWNPNNIYSTANSDNTNNRPMLSARTATGINQNLNIDEKRGGTGGFGGRIASWAGPVSANVRGWADEDEESEEDIGKLRLSSASGLVPSGNGKERERARFDNLVRVVDQEGRLAEEEMEEGSSGEEESPSELPMRRFWRQEKAVEEDMGSIERGKADEERRETTRQRALRAVTRGELRR